MGTYYLIIRQKTKTARERQIGGLTTKKQRLIAPQHSATLWLIKVACGAGEKEETSRRKPKLFDVTKAKGNNDCSECLSSVLLGQMPTTIIKCNSEGTALKQRGDESIVTV